MRDGSIIPRRAGWTALIVAVLAASAVCAPEYSTAPPTIPPDCTDGPAAGNTILAQFSAPFTGTYPLTNYFDHDLPGVPGNTYQLSYCGQRVGGRIDGHAGYDWVMPAGTPMLAVAEGEVTFAGTEAPFYCELLGRTVSDGQVVEIRHPPVGGEQFTSGYLHLSRIDVVVGQAVARGDTLGLSGSTGCSTEPHLHLQVWRHTHTNDGTPAVVDPYGWQGEGSDPWSLEPSGSASAWLWRPGEAPLLRLRALTTASTR
jgi:murein DD-endopeptidase MepM/ murein hydrolase activator NlpD